MYHAYPRTAIIAVALAMQIASSSAWAASFTVSSTDNTAKTLAAGQTGTVTDTGTLSVSGSTVAVTMSGNNATLTNNGTIQQTGSGRVIRDNTGVTGLLVNNGSLTNSTALLQSADADVIQMNKPAGTVTLNNYGTMASLNASGGGAQAVDFNAVTGANTVNNFATGVIQALNADAVRPGVNGVVNNSGILKSTTTTDSSSDGVDVQNNTGVQITNDAGGLLDGARHGVTGGQVDANTNFTATITNNAGGTIQGENGSGINLDGFNALQTATIMNSGTIIGNGVTGDGDGIDVDGIANIINTGIIRSLNAFSLPADGVAKSEGITLGGGSIINSGTIEGLVASGNTNAAGRGITLTGNDITSGPLSGTREAIHGNVAVTNNAGGLIRGDSDSAIAVEGPASLSGFTVQISNNTGATIQGGGTTNAAIWVRSDNVPANPGITVMNEGTIDGSSSGKAIALGKGDDLVRLFGGTVIGTIDGGLGTNTLQTNGTQTFSGATILNFQNLNVLGGTTSMNGSNIFTNGSTVASGGSLIVGSSETDNNALLVSSVTVSSGATLGGYGGIAGTVSNSGYVAPGNSIGTLSIYGNYTQTSGSTYAVEIDALGNSDLILVKDTSPASGVGSAAINGGTADIQPLSGTCRWGRYTILTADNGVSGTFDNLTGTLPSIFMVSSLSYDPYNVCLDITSDFRDHANTENRYAVANVLDNISPATTGDMRDVMTCFINLPAVDAALSAIDQTSGHIHTALPGATLYSVDQNFKAIRSNWEWSGEKGNHGLKNGFWASGFKGVGNDDGFDIGSKYEYNLGGGVVGYGHLLSDTFLLGASAGYSSMDVTMNNLLEKGNVLSWQGSLYALSKNGPWHVGVIASYGHHRYDTERNISFCEISRQATALYDGNSLSALLEAGYKVEFGNHAYITPTASFQALRLSRDAFTEQSASALDLIVTKEDTTSLPGRLGLVIGKNSRDSNGGSFNFELYGFLRHDFGSDILYSQTAAFAGSPDFAFVIKGDTRKRDRYELGIKLAYETSSHFSFFSACNANLTKDLTEQTGLVGFSFKW
jgi:uncharacterized protein with beta-barrel porin domain